VSLIAPLFFGVAHIHHAVVRLQKASSSSASSFRPSVSSVILMTTFQFIYTTLFGAYATYILIRTGSVLAVTVSHSYCNLMGLPDLSFFLHPNHPMYRYRVTILTSYLIGVFTFKHFLLCSTDETCWGSKSLLPLPSELFSMLSIQ
jgi:prenyl protein peptidase